MEKLTGLLYWLAHLDFLPNAQSPARPIWLIISFFVHLKDNDKILWTRSDDINHLVGKFSISICSMSCPYKCHCMLPVVSGARGDGLVLVTNIKPVLQPGLRSIWEKYYEEAHAVVFVIDASCPSRFEDSKSALEKVLRNDDLQGAPVLILANKQDLPEAVSTEELAQYLDLKKLDERVSMYEAVSAYDGLGIRESVEWLVEVMERSKRTEMLSARAGLTPA
ncbi:hypothetical protein SAY87_008223 [Trapa incisa]|uniref:ADP-ribosylation factor-like protein 3 n=1 Tax=Trapa incisa TaxID=236973 RepID=A0AAN7KM99_9MYRT|nr:hypothetical protein SAY87_008223 [Trapa incisa]